MCYITDIILFDDIIYIKYHQLFFDLSELLFIFAAK